MAVGSVFLTPEIVEVGSFVNKGVPYFERMFGAVGVNIDEGRAYFILKGILNGVKYNIESFEVDPQEGHAMNTKINDAINRYLRFESQIYLNVSYSKTKATVKQLDT